MCAPAKSRRNRFVDARIRLELSVKNFTSRMTARIMHLKNCALMTLVSGRMSPLRWNTSLRSNTRTRARFKLIPFFALATLSLPISVPMPNSGSSKSGINVLSALFIGMADAGPASDSERFGWSTTAGDKLRPFFLLGRNCRCTPNEVVYTCLAPLITCAVV